MEYCSKIFNLHLQYNHSEDPSHLITFKSTGSYNAHKKMKLTESMGPSETLRKTNTQQKQLAINAFP